MSEMSEMTEWPEVRAIDWSELPGAYGTERDAASALEALRAGPDAEDGFAEACEDFLWGHVWHQGTIYPITPRVLPFVIEVLLTLPDDEEVDERYVEVAELLLACAASARHASDRAVGDQVLAVFTEHGEDLRRLTSFSSSTLAVMACVPGLADHVLSGAEYPQRTVAAALLSRVDRIDFDPSLLIWAAPHVAQVQHAVTRAAAEILKTGDVSANAERLAAVGEAIGFSSADLTKHYLDELRPRFGISPPPHNHERPGETRALVVVSEADWFVVQVDGANVTIRWQGHPFVERDAVVLTDISKRNTPRAVRGTGEKEERAARFDEKGRML
jgi:hypothetical protein